MGARPAGIVMSQEGWIEVSQILKLPVFPIMQVKEWELHRAVLAEIRTELKRNPDKGNRMSSESRLGSSRSELTLHAEA